MSKDPHFESLRRAYDERVKSLTKKLKSTYASLQDDDGHHGNTNGKELASSPSAHALQQRMQEIVESQLTGDKDKQLDAVLSQVAILKTAKKHLTQDLENVEKQSETNLREMKNELAHVQQQLADTRREHTRVLQQLKDNERYSMSEKEWSMRSMEEKFKYQDNRAISLEEQLADKNQELIVLTEENREFRQRLERLYHERAKWQEEMMAQSRTQKNIAGELDEAQRLLAQSEVERIQLRSQYVNVGEKFERLMDVEERENSDTVRQLVEKLKEQKERSERYKKKCDRLSAEGTTRQSELRTFITRIEDKDEEIERLTQRVNQETEKQRLVRSEMLEMQQKSFREQAECLEKTTSMFPIASHHQILDEQCQQHALALQEQQAQVQKLRNDLEVAEKKRVKELHDAISRTNKSVEDAERQRDDSIKVGIRSEDECTVLRKALEQCDHTVRESTDVKKKLTISLEEAHQNIIKLRQLLDEENERRLESEQTVGELRVELTCSQELLGSRQKDLDHQARWAEEFETTFGKQLRGAEQEVDRLIDRCRDFESKEEIHKSHCDELQKRIDLAEAEKQRTSQRLVLEQQHARRTCECFNRLNSITQTQIESLRKEKEMLKDSVILEFEHMASLWSSNVMDQWQRLCSQHSKAQHTKAELRTKLEESVRQNSNMASPSGKRVICTPLLAPQTFQRYSKPQDGISTKQQTRVWKWKKRKRAVASGMHGKKSTTYSSATWPRHR
eukprot:GEMP01014623.1.p1 GENE.GEMP01014623.1~~GEMP01014623.1.p1  ORF type:complete len:735 (+),score=161.63 GEMP01014623.1:95-2299(+)